MNKKLYKCPKCGSLLNKRVIFEEGVYEYICPKCNLSVCIYIENNERGADMKEGAENNE